MENIGKIIQYIVQTFSEWFDSICHPYLTCNSISSGQLSSRDKLTKSLQIWTTSYVIALIVQIPLYRFVGIDWKDLGFLLPNTIILLFILILSGAMFHIALKLRKIPSKLTDTIAIYTVVVGCFSPVVAVMAYPLNINFYLLMQRAKHANLSLNETVSNIYSGVFHPSPGYVNYVNVFTSPLFVFINNLLLAMLINVTYRHYVVSKYKVVSAMALLSLVGFIPMLLLSSILILLLYEAIS